jgi:predicted RNA-binding Zn-ribbon protein involved in translation (DUF1610 family)
MATASQKVPVEIHRCPACGAAVKTTTPAQRVRCPSCREVVVLGAMPVDTSGPPPPSLPAQRDRIADLEDRVARLEKMVADVLRATAEAGPLRMKCAPNEATEEFTPARADMLLRNLSTVTAHEITIQSPASDPEAWDRAEWFKAVFERACWPVRGPEVGPADSRGLALATSLPVTPNAAATFLAFRASGFDLVTAFDPTLGAAEERLMVP